MSVGGFYEDSIQSIVALENNSALVGGTFTSSIMIGDNGHDSNQLGFDDMDGFLAVANETNEWNFSESFGSFIGVDSVESIALLSDGDVIVAETIALVVQDCNAT